MPTAACAMNISDFANISMRFYGQKLLFLPDNVPIVMAAAQI
jgi:hypothetical protein